LNKPATRARSRRRHRYYWDDITGTAIFPTNNTLCSRSDAARVVLHEIKEAQGWY
jgi:hypothetical protein